MFFTELIFKKVMTEGGNKDLYTELHKNRDTLLWLVIRHNNLKVATK